MCTTSADCAHLGEGWFCDTPHSGCCTDPPAELSRCIAPCGAAYPPPPTTTTTTTTAPEDETAEPDEPDTTDDGEPAHLRPTETHPEGLLFFSRQTDGSGTYFFGEEDRGTFQLSHVMFEAADGTTSVVVLNEQLIPVSWVAPRVSITASVEERDAELDASDAFHSVVIDAEESLHRFDLVPRDWTALLSRFEAYTGESQREAKAALRGVPSDWTELVAAAQQRAPEQPQRLANAVGLSITHAVLLLLAEAGLLTDEDPEPTDPEGDPDGGGDGDEPITNEEATDENAAGDFGALVPASFPSPRAGGAARAISLPGAQVMGPILESMAKSAMLNFGAEKTFGPKPPTDPNVPAMNVLLCQGATSWGMVCHYRYFNADDIMGCVDFCKTDLSCYTNICMPVTIAAR